MHRTTVMLEESLYRQIKRTAVDRGRPMRALVEEALRVYLGLSLARVKKNLPKFGIYQARVQTDMTRRDLYGYYLKGKM